LIGSAVVVGIGAVVIINAGDFVGAIVSLGVGRDDIRVFTVSDVSKAI